jgi:hypothetical protein
MYGKKQAVSYNVALFGGTNKASWPHLRAKLKPYTRLKFDVTEPAKSQWPFEDW